MLLMESASPAFLESNYTKELKQRKKFLPYKTLLIFNDRNLFKWRNTENAI